MHGNVCEVQPPMNYVLCYNTRAYYCILVVKYIVIVMCETIVALVLTNVTVTHADMLKHGIARMCGRRHTV